LPPPFLVGWGQRIDQRESLLGTRGYSWRGRRGTYEPHTPGSRPQVAPSGLQGPVPVGKCPAIPPPFLGETILPRATQPGPRSARTPRPSRDPVSLLPRAPITKGVSPPSVISTIKSPSAKSNSPLRGSPQLPAPALRVAGSTPAVERALPERRS
jgi:hypothetical protein